MFMDFELIASIILSVGITYIIDKYWDDAGRTWTF